MPISICVDTGRILSNLKLLRNDAKDKKICAVVKANAYGHGAIEVAETIEKHTDYFGVFNVEEGINLRKAGINKPILAFSFLESDAELCIKHSITAGISSIEQAEALTVISRKLSCDAYVHIQVDSGMGRFGVQDERSLVNLLNACNDLSVTGVYSHLYSRESYLSQIERFKTFENIVKGYYPSVISHISSSSAISEGDIYGDMIRPGLALYGYPRNKYLPAMKITGRVLNVSKIKPNETSGYDGIFRADKEGAEIAVVEGGYADGILRNRRGLSFVLYKGSFLPIVAVCMDSVFVFTKGVNIKRGDKVYFVGESEGIEYYFDDIARSVGTIPYELMTNTGKRARINYVDFKT